MTQRSRKRAPKSEIGTVTTEEDAFVRSLLVRRPKLVHRLDRDTSGVMVVAKTSPAAAHLSAQFADRSTQKNYLALVSGVTDAREGIIELPLIRFTSSGIDLVRAAHLTEEGAQAARTDWHVAVTGTKATLVEVTPHTGRMHQIRAHLAAIGHPIAGDIKYGGLFSLGAVTFPRLMLHASKLTFVHPSTGEPVSFEAPWPDDFNSPMAALGMTLD
jgi:23S rRNA pseudouridine955/2504/2580 synthase